MFEKLRPKAQEWLYSTEFREMDFKSFNSDLETVIYDVKSFLPKTSVTDRL